ncbi:hypothetical protein U9M48_026335, partial [Paspalum notatum var. saurae]
MATGITATAAAMRTTAEVIKHLESVICVTIYVECASPDLGVWLLRNWEGLPSEGTLVNFTASVHNDTINWDDFPGFDCYYCIDLDILSCHHFP